MGKVEIGKCTYGEPRILFSEFSDSSVIIGKFCSIAEDVRILLGGEHHTNFISNYPIRAKLLNKEYKEISKGDVKIGNDVWIGTGAIILSGVVIGDGTVIGAGSVVSANVDPYTIVAGNPIKYIRHRFDKDIIKILTEIKWWDWPEENIKEASSIIESVNINNLYKYYLDNIKCC